MSDWDLEIQQNDSPLRTNYERLGNLNVRTKADVDKIQPRFQSSILDKDEQLDYEIGSALRLKHRNIKQVQKESQFNCPRNTSFHNNPSQLNISRESIEKKGILRSRGSLHSSSSSENVSQKHVRFNEESSKFVHMVLK